MSYIINNTRGQVVAVVADGTVNTSATDLFLVGRALTDYGTYENENYVYLLENFANSTPPTQPILGQLWYNSATDVISTYSSTNTWIPLATEAYVQAQKISPAFTGIPTAPTAGTGTATTQLATTAFVTNSPAFAGTPTAPTAISTTSNNQIATTAFVTQSPQFIGVPTAPTAPAGTATIQLATTEFVTVAPQFTGNATAVTAVDGTDTTQIATTEFVQNLRANIVLTGVPTAPYAAYGDNTSQIATTGWVQGEKNSPVFTGVPTAPTALITVSNTQIATTRFVTDWTNALPTMSQQNANAVNITGGTISGITPLAIASGGTGGNTAAAARSGLELGNIAIMNTSNVAFTGGTVDNIVITGGNVSGLNAPLAVADGGTGSANASGARTNLGFGTIATQNANAIAITGGTITGVSPIAVASGGTGSSTPDGARNNLGLGTMATQNAESVGITGGTLSGITVLNASGVNITSGTITGVTDIAVADGGTGASDAANARTNLGAASTATTITVGAGLSGGGTLGSNVTIGIASNSNGFGVRYVSTAAPSGGNNGDIWYQI
jgi:hypothetical protein